MRIDVFTVGRSDYGILRPVLSCLTAHTSWDIGLIVSGGHLHDIAGVSLKDIEKDGYLIRAKIPLTHVDVDQDADSGPSSVARMMGEACAGLGEVYRDERPDLVIALGDRFEMFALVSALVPFNIPIAHLHGGEVSFGAIDEVFRHCITKMAHLHFAATPQYGQRIIQMGEDPWRVTVSGAPGLDTVSQQSLPSREQLEQQFGLDLSTPPILTTFHPQTRGGVSPGDQVATLLEALSARPEPMVITAPNLDTGHEQIRQAYERYLVQMPSARLVENFGMTNYLAMLRECAAVVGNSSSGLVETPLFEAPVLNIGDRQDGRIRGANVVDVACTESAISDGLTKILAPAFKENLQGMENPYGDGKASMRILEKLKQTSFDESLVYKRFYDLEQSHLPEC